MFTKNIKIITIILTAFLLSGCQRINFHGSQSQSVLQNAAESPSSAPKFPGNLQNLDLSGNSEINLPGITPPVIGFNTAAGKSQEGIRVISGRLIPVADKEGKTMVGWRIIGEMYNNSQQLFDNGQIIVGIGDRVLLAEPVQPGGFLPVAAGERMVYDTLIGEVFQGDNITIGSRKVKEASPYLPIDVENLEFKRIAYNTDNSADAESQSTTSSVVPQNIARIKFTVSGTIRNTSAQPVTNLIVRFWVVAEKPEENSEEIIAVGTWQAIQEVLAPEQTRDFEAEVRGLTGADKEKLESGKNLGLSVAGAGKKL